MRKELKKLDRVEEKLSTELQSYEEMHGPFIFEGRRYMDRMLEEMQAKQSEREVKRQKLDTATKKSSTLASTTSMSSTSPFVSKLSTASKTRTTPRFGSPLRSANHDLE